MRALAILRRGVGDPRPWLAGLLLVASLLPRPAAAANRAEVTETTITISVPIDIIRETVQGEPSYYVSLWSAAIHIWWNRDGDYFEVACPDGTKRRKVIFRPDIQVRSRATGFREDAHMIAAMESQRGLDSPYYLGAETYEPGVFDPTSETTSGRWPEEAPPAMIAHEFGHLLGLLDEYEIGQPGRPAPGYEADSLMVSLEGQVLQRHIDEIVGKYVAGPGLGCDPGGEPGAPVGGAPPAGPEPDPGPAGGTPSGGVPGPGPGSAAGPAPDLGCELTPTTLHRNAVMQDASGVRVNCRLRIVGCAEPIELNVTVNARAGEKCPWFEGTTVADRVPGPRVCCGALQRCPGDLDCDNVPDQEDPLPLDPSNGRPRGGTVPRLEGLLLSFFDLPAPRPDEACPLLRM